MTGIEVAAAAAISPVIAKLISKVVSKLIRDQRQADTKRQPPDTESGSNICQPKRFSYHKLAQATDNFAEELKLGKGGFGPVYRGYLTDQDRHVAIKVWAKQSSSQGHKEFEAEMEVLTQLRHRNIVQLVGWCNSRRKGLLLVYELISEGSLDMHLYHHPEKILTWHQRYNIVLGLGSALQHLHQDCEKCIVHGDIKPANIMLDASYNAKLGDFGLARLIEHGADPPSTQFVAGTPGYIDPEFINNRWRCTQLDVYSFGVVLLEVACGKRPASRHPNEAPILLDWVFDLHHDQSRILDAADPRLNGEFDRRQMESVLLAGLWCVHPDQSQRPSIVEAMDFLRSAQAKLPVIPARPDAERNRFLEAQAFGDVTVEYHSAVSVVAATGYHTSKDSA